MTRKLLITGRNTVMRSFLPACHAAVITDEACPRLVPRENSLAHAAPQQKRGEMNDPEMRGIKNVKKVLIKSGFPALLPVIQEDKRQEKKYEAVRAAAEVIELVLQT